MRKNIIILFLCLLFCGCKKGRLFIEIPNNLIFNEGIISELFHYYSNRYETNDEKILVEITEEDLLKIENCIETIISLNDLNLFNYEYSVNKNKPFFYNSVFLNELGEIELNTEESFHWEWNPKDKNAETTGSNKGYVKIPYINYESELYTMFYNVSAYKMIAEVLRENNRYIFFDFYKYDYEIQYHQNYFSYSYSKIKT